jgi:uncharacterized membrane protein (DUF485 family)
MLFLSVGLLLFMLALYLSAVIAIEFCSDLLRTRWLKAGQHSTGFELSIAAPQ